MANLLKKLFSIFETKKESSGVMFVQGSRKLDLPLESPNDTYDLLKNSQQFAYPGRVRQVFAKSDLSSLKNISREMAMKFIENCNAKIEFKNQNGQDIQS